MRRRLWISAVAVMVAANQLPFWCIYGAWWLRNGRYKSVSEQMETLASSFAGFVSLYASHEAPMQTYQVVHGNYAPFVIGTLATAFVGACATLVLGATQHKAATDRLNQLSPEDRIAVEKESSTAGVPVEEYEHARSKAALPWTAKHASIAQRIAIGTAALLISWGVATQMVEHHHHHMAMPEMTEGMDGASEHNLDTARAWFKEQSPESQRQLRDMAGSMRMDVYEYISFAHICSPTMPAQPDAKPQNLKTTVEPK